LQAIIGKDFDTFADITMKESNQLHAVCLDTFPPNVYMNDTSHAIVNLVHAYNSAGGKTKVSTEIYKTDLYNNRHDAPFFTLFHYHTSTCFRPVWSPSSGGQVYNVAMVLVLLLERLSVVLDEKELQLILVQTR
jgi:hypothetical protein